MTGDHALMGGFRITSAALLFLLTDLRMVIKGVRGDTLDDAEPQNEESWAFIVKVQQQTYT